MFPKRFSLAEILLMVGGAILPVPAGPSSSRISPRLKRVQDVAQFTRAHGCRFHNDTCAAAGFDGVACKGWRQTPEQFQFDQAGP